MKETTAATPRAVLVGILLPGMTETDLQASLKELSRLVDTLGYRVVHTLTQKRGSSASAAVLGEGKLKELAALTGGTGVIPSGAVRKANKAALKRLAEEGDDHPLAFGARSISRSRAASSLRRRARICSSNCACRPVVLHSSRCRRLNLFPSK